MSNSFKNGERVRVLRGRIAGHVGTVVKNKENGWVEINLDSEVNVQIDDTNSLISKSILTPESNLEFLDFNKSHKSESTSNLTIETISEVPKENQSLSTTPSLTIKEAFQREHESKKPKHYGQAATWIENGLCPHCGEKGYVSQSRFVCSKHGIY